MFFAGLDSRQNTWGGPAVCCGVLLVEPWLQGSSWGWASGPCWAVALCATLLGGCPQEGEQGGDCDIWWPEARLWLPSVLWELVTCAAMVRFFIDLMLLYGNHSEIFIQLKVGFMAGDTILLVQNLPHWLRKNVNPLTTLALIKRSMGSCSPL